MFEKLFFTMPVRSHVNGESGGSPLRENDGVGSDTLRSHFQTFSAPGRVFQIFHF